jgi:hypothetical protein
MHRRHRPGKALLLPVATDDGSATYLPIVSVAERCGALGRIGVLRYHPFMGSTNPCGQVLLRCNWDVQCMDRVFVPASDMRWDLLSQTPCDKGTGGDERESDDDGGECSLIVSAPVDGLPVDVSTDVPEVQPPPPLLGVGGLYHAGF